ncbi:predicted protein [Uncinocarpus reesii 1704]|uniref:Uncharacterized protein n=1 Tax=Uncinocarpus reesii (strain UAMH 1704) TaxID=336963 RepID=C4JU76_UNCRE|nr:uncharacterized protein UREG_06015 [Uncinocarpus reesii 1704]EEP81173.1 predicted protein [Uncinocarpus reesii 1704]
MANLAVVKEPATAMKSIGQKSQTPNDYGTPNLLFLFYIPPVPDSEREKLNSLKADIQSWFAFEAGKAELQVEDRLEAGELTADDSAALRVKRTIYRAKVVNFYRNDGQAWAPRSSADKGQRDITAKKQDMNGVIRKELLDHYIRSGVVPAQFSFILQAVNLLIAANPDWEHKYLFTHVVFKYNDAKKAITPYIFVSDFEVKLPELQDDDSEESVAIDYSDYKLDFVRATWDKTKGEAKDFIASGERICRQMSLELCIN